MSSLCRMVNVAEGVGKDRMNTLKTKGVDTVLSTIDLKNGILAIKKRLPQHDS